MILYIDEPLLKTKLKGCDGAFILQDYIVSVTRNNTTLECRVSFKFVYNDNSKAYLYISHSVYPQWDKNEEMDFDYEHKFCALALKQYDPDYDWRMQKNESKIIRFDAGVPDEETGKYICRNVQGRIRLTEQMVVFP